MSLIITWQVNLFTVYSTIFSLRYLLRLVVYAPFALYFLMWLGYVMPSLYCSMARPLATASYWYWVKHGRNRVRLGRILRDRITWQWSGGRGGRGTTLAIRYPHERSAKKTGRARAYGAHATPADGGQPDVIRSDGSRKRENTKPINVETQRKARPTLQRNSRFGNFRRLNLTRIENVSPGVL